ncbi:MAG TPA: sensor histidine kinase [Pseudonocardiaceae bacterium]
MRSGLRTAAVALRPPLRDVLLACGLTVFVTGSTTGLAAHWQHPGPHLGLPATLWVIAGGVPLLWRRRAPLTAFLVSAALVLSYYRSGYPAGPSAILPTVVLITLAFLRGPLVAGIAGGAVVLVVAVLVLVSGDQNGALDARLVGLLLWAAVAVVIGTIGQVRRTAIRSAAERAAEADRRRAEEQRLGIAREVHDVVAHSLAMINVQAGVAAHVADRRPDEAKAALLAIKEASRSALADLRATLGVLRSGDDRAPTPGLGRLPDLISIASAAGITVEADGDAGSLPAPVDVAAYRILQECLTNVVRHGRGADTVTIRLVRTGDQLEITVRDNGHGTKPTAAAGGNGLRGMAERATALGGETTAGPAPGGGYQVYARLPLIGEIA